MGAPVILSVETVLLVVVYAAYIASPLLPDELWLRLALAGTSAGFVMWGAIIGNAVVIVANALFLIMSVRQVVRLLRQRRPIELDGDLALVHDALFPTMSARQFLLFWHLGEELVAENVELLKRGESSPFLFALHAGAADVHLDSGIRQLDAPALLGEMSYVRGAHAPATADVTAAGPVECRRWRKDDLHRLNQSHPDLVAPFLRGLGADIAGKLDS